MDEVIQSYGDKVELKIVAGGYSPGTTEPMSQGFKNMLQKAWRKINEVTDQPFDFSMQFDDDDFCYDTEPSSRALVTVQETLPEVECLTPKVLGYACPMRLARWSQPSL